MTARERVLNCLAGEKTDRIPFTLYECFAGYCHDIEHHLKRGLGIVYRVSSARTEMEGVEVKTTPFQENGKRMQRTDYRTPVGDLYTLKEIGEGTTWTKEHLFKTPEDYKPLQYMFEHKRAYADYERVEKIQSELSEQYIMRDGLALEPLQELISSDIMDCITFSTEWYDNRDLIDALYKANVKHHEKLYEIVAKGPISQCNYGGNVVPQIIGPQVFKEYYMPHYNAAADIFHRHGKLLGTHLDGDNRPIMDLIADTSLDYIEAYDPSISPPLWEAKQKLGSKAIWINWPSGQHYRADDEIAKISADLAEDFGTGGRLLFAITEDLPAGRWDIIIKGILDGLGYPK